MGSKSRSSTSSRHSTTQTSNVTNDNISDIDDSLILRDVDNIAVETSDHSAVNSAFEFAGKVVEEQQEQIADTLKSINAANSNSADLDAATRADTAKTIAKYGVYAVGLVAVVFLLTR